jgi:hypothetical protein
VSYWVLRAGNLPVAGCASPTQPQSVVSDGIFPRRFCCCRWHADVQMQPWALLGTCCTCCDTQAPACWLPTSLPPVSLRSDAAHVQDDPRCRHAGCMLGRSEAAPSYPAWRLALLLVLVLSDPAPAALPAPLPAWRLDAVSCTHAATGALSTFLQASCVFGASANDCQLQLGDLHRWATAGATSPHPWLEGRL